MQEKKKFKTLGNHTSIAIIGLGYVGLPLAIEFSKKYQTYGFDKNKDRIKELKSGIDNTLEVSDSELSKAKIRFSTELEDISHCNIYIITVPTPVDNYNNPDMSSLASASGAISKVMKKNDLVIYESTVYPGATEHFCVPLLEKNSGLTYNKDFFCGYSPERIDPGNKKYNLTNITKITSGSNKEVAEFVNELYQNIITVGTYMASSIQVAEAAKVIENIQRDVNIALINELSKIFNKLEIDTTEVLNAASTKWNFLKFYPGLVGGHCIGVDPYYLTHRATEIGYHPEIILAGRRINDSMGNYVAESAIKEMVRNGINPIGAKVAVFGITFKENCPDLRNTKVPDIINELKNYGCNVFITDPYADKSIARKLYNVELTHQNEIADIDVIIVAVAHDEYKSISKNKWQSLLNKNSVFVDIKSILPQNFFDKTKVTHWRL